MTQLHGMPEGDEDFRQPLGGNEELQLLNAQERQLVDVMATNGAVILEA